MRLRKRKDSLFFVERIIYLYLSASQHQCRALTKLRFRWKELNFDVLKYFGRMSDEKECTSTIRKAAPESDHMIAWVSFETDSDWSILYNLLGNCWGTPLFPVRGYETMFMFFPSEGICNVKNECFMEKAKNRWVASAVFDDCKRMNIASWHV